MRRTHRIISHVIRVGLLSAVFAGASFLLAEAVREETGPAITNTEVPATAPDALAGGKTRATRTSSRSTRASRSSGSTRTSRGTRTTRTSTSKSSYPRRSVDTSRYRSTRHPGRHRGSSHHSSNGSRYVYYNHPYGYGFGYPYGYYYGYGWGFGHYLNYWPGFYFSLHHGPGFWWGYPYNRQYVRYADDYDAGSLDLNVKPKKTEVYLNGYFIGKTGAFDGWPGHLNLREGTYELIFYLEGFETVRKEYTVHAGIVTRDRFDMVSGEAVKPTEISDPPKQAIPERKPRAYATYRRGAGRSMADHPIARRRLEPPVADTGSGPESDERDLRVEPARVSFVIEPADASVYLDGKLVGSAAELQKSDKLLLDVGEHTLEVIRPGYKPHQQTFIVESGKTLNLDVILEKE
jgi:hypothetical protein